MPHILTCCLLLFTAHVLPGAQHSEIESALDGVMQPCLLYPAPEGEAAPLLIFLHTWSTRYDNFDHTAWRQEAAKHGWHMLIPHYRGPNDNPMACASPESLQDVLDAVNWMIENHRVDEKRIYLAGTSGGGHMAMALAAHAPARWTAVSAWCGITDLAAWHRECKAAGWKYAEDIEKVCGGAPGDAPEVDRQLKLRSPLYHLAAAKAVPLDINAGIHDGHAGSVPVHHTLDAFNAIARARGDTPVPAEIIKALSREETPAGPVPEDASYGRDLHFRRESGPCRVTIFEGGHEGLAPAACAWLAAHPEQHPAARALTGRQRLAP
jgi:dipeptidyl aminopeptidase/acylaminoacyl peptidase